MNLKVYAKAIVAALGAGLTAASGIVAKDSAAGQVITVALAVITAASVYAVPNARPVPASAQHLNGGTK